MKKFWNWDIAIDGKNFRVQLEYNIGLIRKMKIYINDHLSKLVRINRGEEGVDYFFCINNSECCIYSRMVGDKLHYSLALGSTDLITGETIEYVKPLPKAQKVKIKMTKTEIAIRAFIFIITLFPIIILINFVLEWLLIKLNCQLNYDLNSAIGSSITMGFFILISDFLVNLLKKKGWLKETEKPCLAEKD
ncbi:hypothetical protein [Serpentinicella alkaliphila]|uniref:Uncharacterized protein n=1 Tax=Serpentinicella alkaliphila TaxID=1734049 RepID=A0A4R2TCX2_9FIRM|nr:hypothetical protein [Serpentinicella alkaliphila]QUH25822.1 hypothetical protein HZR23_08800 [Serpentinicella alkaliphila]TCP99841.1 hypothetical protein EDD79_103229 [Serpentinicella alkaliphila]